MTILHNSLSAAVLIAVIALVRSVALHKLPKNTFCVLWTATALRLILPFSIKSKFSFYTFLHPLLQDNGNNLIAFVSSIRPEAQVEMKNATHGPFPALVVLWLTGFCILAIFFLLSYIRSMQMFKCSTPVSNADIESLAIKSCGLFPVQIRQTERITGPLTYGFFRPVILLPETTDWADTKKLSFALAHEYTHIRRHDCVTKLLFITALCIHWFNPAVWLLCWFANRDIELACDEKTILSLGEANRFSYARTLLVQAERSSDLFPLFSHFGKHAVEERVVSALKLQRRSVWRVVSACLLVLGTLMVFATSAASGTKSEASASPASQNIFPNEMWICACVSSSDPTEAFDRIKLTTLDGEPYPLKSGQPFSFLLNDEAVEQGAAFCTIQEGLGKYLVLKADFRLISRKPLSCTLGGLQFDVEGDIS